VNKRHIYIYSPSSAVRDHAAFRRGIRRLKALGHEVEVDPAALRSHQRFAGEDDVRIAAIERAAHSGADVALISRGGYGLTRILPRLPYEAIARSVERGMHWVGLSDFTALQLALMAHQQRALSLQPSDPNGFGRGAVTWAGPALGEDFGADPLLGSDEQPLPDDIMEDCFEDLLCGQGEGAGWRLSLGDRKALRGASPTSDALHRAATTAAPGLIEHAVLWGGNLSVLATLVGTPHMPNVRGGILFLEDVNEHPYRIERLLTQLLCAGVLSGQRAVLLGAFSRYKLVAGHDRGYDLGAVVSWLRQQLSTAPFCGPDGVPVPVFTGLPFGHVPTKVLLPVGCPVDFAWEGRDALLVWERH
jgi:muramoyltetrapeptide carboxypeptidase